MYTGVGGGGLTLTDITFREKGTSDAWILHASDVDLIANPNPGQKWYGVITNSHFAAITDVEFLLTTRNTMNRGVLTTVSQILRK